MTGIYLIRLRDYGYEIIGEKINKILPYYEEIILEDYDSLNEYVLDVIDVIEKTLDGYGIHVMRYQFCKTSQNPVFGFDETYMHYHMVSNLKDVMRPITFGIANEVLTGLIRSGQIYDIINIRLREVD